MRISGLYLYPVKSGAAMAADAWDLDERGLTHDREYMVVDETGKFLTQREAPPLALLVPELGERLRVTTSHGTAVEAPNGQREVQVWGYSGSAVDCGDDVAGLVSTLLGRSARLVRTAAGHDRLSDDGRSPIGFSDGFPLLLTTEESLEDLNSRLPAQLPMNRFRPNVVVTGCAPYEEDEWLNVDLGGVPAEVVKPCLRCAITRVDQRTGVRGDGEPLKTLGTFRKRKGGVAFGQNLVHATTGRIQVGDPVTVRERRA